jgi:hypothetical protein
MRRVFEWVLAGIGAILCIGAAISIWSLEAASNPPGVSMWPMPALILIEVALLGTVGLLGIVLEPKLSPSRWAVLTWIACGALMGLSILGDLAVSVIAYLGVPALFFGGASVLTDMRRQRKLLPDFGILILSGIVAFALLYAYLVFAG